MQLYILLFLYLWIKNVTAIGCPSGWVLYRTNCYLFQNDELKVFDEADAACWSYGARLLSVETQREDAFIANWLHTNTLSRHTYWYTSGRFSRDSSLIYWEGINQFIQYGSHWLTSRQLSIGDNSDIVYTLVYAFTGKTYEWLNVTSNYVCGYICEISSSDVDYFYVLERDFEYGYASIEKAAIQKGPVFTLLSNDTVVFETVIKAEVECLASSNPISKYTFFKGRSYLNPERVLPSERHTITGGKLTIQDLDKEQDDNMYFCRATNEVGTTLSEMVRVSFGYLGDFPNNEMEPLVAKAFEGTKMECHQPRHSPSPYPEIPD